MKTNFSLLLFVFLLLGSANSYAGLLDKLGDLFQAPTSKTDSSQLGQKEIAGGLKDALKVSTDHVVTQLSAPGGFNSDPSIRIPLPNSLIAAQKTMNKFGMGGMLNDLELKLNEAAEQATAKAKPLFINAIKQMSWQDAKAILNGPDDAATRYFEGKVAPDLAKEMRPLVAESLQQVDAVKSYDRLMTKYSQLPLVPDVKADLSQHVVDQGIRGIFFYLAKEEAAIRNNPAKRTTELLQKVFN